jgi:uncharacterized surface protein with fasciclin (FAS1) repeats
MKTYFKFAGFLLISLLVVLCINMGCKKQAMQYSTTSDVNIVDYLREYPSQFSEFVKILDRTNISSYLNAYGAYTCFAPTNDAIKLYLTQIGKSSTADLDTAALKKIIRLHLIQDTLSTPSFNDGKLATPTMYGQYLIMGTTISDGTTSILVNRQAKITQSNILTGNGYIHVIDHVLQPANQTLAAMVEANTKYSIFTQALKATGLYDTLNINNNTDTTRRWLTLIAESDSVLKVAGVNSYADLVKKYNNTGNPKNTSDSLFLYMAYHIMTGIKYMADIVSASSHPTLAPLNVIGATLSGDSIILNRATFNGSFEFGTLLDRHNSDNSATNGAMHCLLGDIYIKVRTPVRLYWDVADQPELRKLTSIFRKSGQSYLNIAPGYFSGITWQNTTLTAVSYIVIGTAETKGLGYWYDDYLGINLRVQPNQNQWIEFTTPLLVAGKYKVWVCVRNCTQGKYIQASVDGVALPKVMDLTANPGVLSTDAVLESQGFKHYDSTSTYALGFHFAVLAGTVTINTTDTHKFRLTAIKDYSSSGNTVYLDMIEFIPVDMDQQYPRVKRDGTMQYIAH